LPEEQVFELHGSTYRFKTEAVDLFPPSRAGDPGGSRGGVSSVTPL